jgi:hypothetical protein
MSSLSTVTVLPTQTCTLTPFPALGPDFFYATRPDGSFITCEANGQMSTRPAGTAGAPGDFQVFQRVGNAAVYQPMRTQTGPAAPTFVFLLVG